MAAKKKAKKEPVAEETVDAGTSAPVATYPEIVPAPPVIEDTWVPDDRPPQAEEQTYPEIVPAEPVREPVPMRPAAHVDPGRGAFAKQIVNALVNAGLMEPE